MYSPNFVIGIYGPKSIQKHITVETEAAPYEITIGLLEICSLGHRRQIWHNHRKVDVWDDIWTSYRDLVLEDVSHLATNMGYSFSFAFSHSTSSQEREDGYITR